MNLHIIKKASLLCISIMLTSSLYGMEDIPLPVVTEGFTGWLYTQSWVLSDQQLLLYAFEHNLFDHKNKTHKQLVRTVLAECRKNKDTETIEKILTLLDKNFSGFRILRNITSRSTHNYLTRQQTDDNEVTACQLSSLQKTQLIAVAEHIGTIQSKIIDAVAALHSYKNAQEKKLEIFRADYRKRRELTFLLHKLDSSIDKDYILENCSDVEDEALVDPALRDDAYINKKVMEDDQFGKNNVLFASFLQQLSAMETTTQELLMLCASDNK